METGRDRAYPVSKRAACCLVLLFAFAAPAAAQPEAEETILLAAVRHIWDDLPKGRIVVYEPTPEPADQHARVRPASLNVAVEVARSLGLQIGRPEVTCEDTLRSIPLSRCSIDGADVLLRLWRPEISGDTARVRVSWVFRANHASGETMAHLGLESIGLELVRRGSVWSVMRELWRGYT